MIASCCGNDGQFSKNTLPAAVDYEDREALAGLDDEHLLGLVIECELWCLWMGGMQDDLTTKAGLTEWDVQMRLDIDEVDAAHGRVRDEIAAREAGIESIASDNE